MRNTMPAASGIYAIIHTASARRYVGSSYNLKKRMREHLSALRNDRHRCPRLQNAWNKYGEDAFSLKVLELCEVAHLVAREQWHIDHRSGFNIRLVAHSHQGVKHSAESKAKMSASQRASHLAERNRKAGELLHSPAVRARTLAATMARLSDPDKLAAALVPLNTPEANMKRAATRQSAVYRENMRMKLAGRPRPPEVRAAISAGRTGLRLSPEAKAARTARMAAKREAL